MTKQNGSSDSTAQATKPEESSTVELLTLHAVNHDGVNYPPHSLLKVSAAHAERLVECGAAQPSDMELDVPVEARAPRGYVAINQTVGQPSTSFMPIDEFQKMREKDYANRH